MNGAIMKLRSHSLLTKLFVLLLFLMLGLSLVLMGVTHITALRSYQTLEQKGVEEDLARVRAAFGERINDLAGKASDWACRDDTALFMQDMNQAYIDANLQDNALSLLNVNLVAFITNSRQVAYAKLIDPGTEKAVSYPAKALTDLAASPVGFNGSIANSRKGIWTFDGRHMILASLPVTAGSGEGPVYGTLIFGRFVDEKFVDALGAMLQMDLAVENNIRGNVLRTSGAPLQLNAQSPYGIVRNGRDSITGYVLLEDILGRPSLVVSSQSSRPIYTLGRTEVANFNLLQVLNVLVVGALVWLVLRLIVLNRLSRLTREVTAIGATRTFDKRLGASPLLHRDEISDLQGSINGMLCEIDKSQKELHETRDLLELKVRERTAELITQKSLVDDILKTLPAAVILVDQNQRVVQANDGFTRMFDLGAHECYGKSLTDLIYHEHLDAAIFEASMNSNVTHGVEFRYRLNDRNRVFRADVIPMPGRRALVILNDVTEEYERQERLFLTDRLASIGEMAAGLAHELNNPLMGILGVSQLAMDGDLPEAVRRNLQEISNEAQRAAVIVRNLLSFARRQENTRQLTDVNKVVQEVLGLREYEHKVNNITVKTYLDPSLPEVVLDRFQMQQVFLNIVLNAASAMTESHHRGVLTVTTESDDDTVRVRFADDGPGIPAALLNRIFDPFFTTKDVGKGTGLGLSVCYGIVTAHGGRILVDGARTEGASFTIELPRTVIKDEKVKEAANVH